MFLQFVYQLQFSCLLLTFDLSLTPFDIFWPLETIQPLNLYLQLHTHPETISTVPFGSMTSLWSIGSVLYLHTFEIPELQQKAGVVHKLKPLSRIPSYLETARPNLHVG